MVMAAENKSKSKSGKGGANDDLDSILNAALNKLQVSEETPEKTKAETSNDPEVDRMLSEFTKMIPGLSPADGAKTSQEQIEETFKKLMAEPMDIGGGSGSGSGDEVDLEGLGDMNKVIEQMMAELTSKDILYEPFSEMVQKYPAYLAEHEATLDPTLTTQYRSQLSTATAVLALFDQPDYAERRAEYQAQIFELMQSMQEYGVPPEGLLKEAAAPGGDGGDGADAGGDEAQMPSCNQM